MLLVAFVAALPCASFAGERRKLDPAEVKAGFIYHLSKLVTWPAGSLEKADSPIIVGFLGDDETAEYFEINSPGFEANGRKLLVKRLEMPDAVEDFFAREKFMEEVKTCNVLFVSSDMEEMNVDYSKLLSFPGLLSIGETKSFVEGDGMIGLVLYKGKYNVYANVENLKLAGFEVSAKFLQHAKIVEKEKKDK